MKKIYAVLHLCTVTKVTWVWMAVCESYYIYQPSTTEIILTLLPRINKTPTFVKVTLKLENC